VTPVLVDSNVILDVVTDDSGKAYLAYRRAGGSRRSPVPDFYIGAHAAVAGYRLLTRDAGRYRTQFPTLELLAP
jgi:predicted nucleic acid-binding protein